MVEGHPANQAVRAVEATLFTASPQPYTTRAYSQSTHRRSQYMATGLLDQATNQQFIPVTARNLHFEGVECAAMYSPQDIRRRARTKIVATVGPASSDTEKLTELLQAGVDVFRLNMAHAGPEEQQRHVDNIRALSEEIDEPIAILVDLAGPKIRLGELPDGRLQCDYGQEFVFVNGAAPQAAERADVDLRAAREGAHGRRSRDAGRRHGEDGRRAQGNWAAFTLASSSAARSAAARASICRA